MRVFFAHTRRCGGSSLIRLFQTSGYVCPGPYTTALSVAFQRSRFRELDLVDVEEDIKDVDFFASEWQFKEELLNLSEFSFAVLREPWSRYMSDFMYSSTYPYGVGTGAKVIEEYLSDEIHTQFDYYTKLFCGMPCRTAREYVAGDRELSKAKRVLDRFSCVAVTEIKETLFPLGAFVDLNKLEKVSSDGDYDTSEMENFKDRFMSGAQKDVELYEHIVERYRRGMKLYFVKSDPDGGFIQDIICWFKDEGHQVVVSEFEGKTFEEHAKVLREVLRVGPHVVHGFEVGFPLLLCQIACGIPTVVQAADNLGAMFSDIVGMDPRESATRRLLQMFSLRSAYAVVTSHKELVTGIKANNSFVRYIPRPMSGGFGEYFSQGGQVALLGAVEGCLEGAEKPEGMAIVNLKGGDIKYWVKDGGKYILIVIAPGYELTQENKEQLCALGIPVARPATEVDIEDGMPFYEYSLEDYPGSVVDLWKYLSSLDGEEYLEVVDAHKGVVGDRSVEAVGRRYLELYEAVVRKAMLHTPVRGW